MINCILFDLADVCVRGILGLEDRISAYTGIDKREVKKHLRGDKLREIFEGRISEDEYWRRVVEAGNYKEPFDFFKASAREHFIEVPGTRSIVEELKRSYYTLGLLSDHAREWIEYIESGYPFIGLFDVRCYSFNSGYTKSDPKSFEFALSKLNADPSKTLFIDDRDKNLDVAKSTGIGYLHQFIDAVSLKKELLRLGVNLNGCS